MDPVAILTFAGNSYQIATDPVDERLHFRSEGATSWEGLENTISDGWTKISAEIVTATNDAMFGFLHTHSMRVDKTDGDEATAVEFEIEGLRWGVGKTDDPAAFRVRLPGEEKGLKVRLQGDPSADWQSIAVRGLISRDHSLEARFGDEVAGWAERIAAGCQISPYM